MTGRTPACEDAAAIAERLRELQAERIAAIAGCNCPSSVRGEKLHVPSCPLRPQQQPSQMELATEALWRARMRSRDAAERYVDHLERAIAEKAARHRIYTPAGPQSELAFERNMARIERFIAMQKASVEEIERATAAMAARHRVLLP